MRDLPPPTSPTGSGGGSFIRIEDLGPKGNQRTVIDGFEISGYSQAIFRDDYQSQRFDITNNYIHDNTCDKAELMGAGFYLNNVTGRILEGNVFRQSCAWAVRGSCKTRSRRIPSSAISSTATMERGRVAGACSSAARRGSGNLFTRNTVTDWGGGLYISAWTEGRQFTTPEPELERLSGNRAKHGRRNVLR